MADFTITIANRLKLHPTGETSKWGTMVWGTDVWGSDRNTDFRIYKYYANTLNLSSSQGFDIGKWLSETINLSGAVYKSVSIKPIDDTISVTSAINFIGIRQGDWLYVIKGVSDPDNRVFPDWSAPTAASTDYTEQTGSDPGWSAA